MVAIKVIVGLHWKETVLVDWIGNVVTSFRYERYFVDRSVSEEIPRILFQKVLCIMASAFIASNFWTIWAKAN